MEVEMGSARDIRLRLAFWLLVGGGAAYAGIASIGLFFVDIDGISREINVNLGVVAVVVWLGWCLNVAAFSALPIAAGIKSRSDSGTSWTMNLVVVGAGVLAVVFAGWLGIGTVLVFGTSLALITVAGIGPRRRGQPYARRSRHLGVAYVLLVAGGGLLGLHHYYLHAAWRGVLYFALLLFGVVAWPTYYSYFLLAGLLLLNGWDAVRMPSRVRQLNKAL